MKSTYVSSLLLIALFSNSIQADNTESNYPSGQSGASNSPIAEIATNALNKASQVAASIYVLTAIGADTFYEDHIKSHPEGHNPDTGNSRIIFSAQYRNVKAYEEGKALGGSALGAFHKCLAAQSYYEDPSVYGIGACDRILVYAPNEHFWGKIKRASKLYVFIPVAVVSAAITGYVSFRVYKKMKKD